MFIDSRCGFTRDKKKDERSGFVLFQVWIHFLRGICVAMSRIKN